MEPKTLDHVAFWVTERDAIVDFATIESRHARHRPAGQLHADRLGRAPRQADAVRRRGAARARRVQACRAARELGRRRRSLHVARRESRCGSSRRRPRSSTTSITSRCTRRIPRSPPRRISTTGSRRAEPKDGVPRVEVGGAYVEFHEGDPGGLGAAVAQPPRGARRLGGRPQARRRGAGHRGRAVRRRREHVARSSSGARIAFASSTSSTSPRSR